MEQGYCAEDAINDVIKRVKAVNGAVVGIAYINSAFSYPWYHFGQFLIHNTQYVLPGHPCVIDQYGWMACLPDFSTTAGEAKFGRPSST